MWKSNWLSRFIGAASSQDKFARAPPDHGKPAGRRCGVPIVLDRARKEQEALASDRPALSAAFGIIAVVLMVAAAKAQDAKPRSYTNTPVGLNFLIAGYLYSQGKMAFDPELSIASGHGIVEDTSRRRQTVTLRPEA
jgi:hypothetical protein